MTAGSVTTAPIDVLTIGRCSVDVYPDQIGVGLDEVTSFGKYLGGSPTNVAVAAARHGRSAAVITRTGPDSLGRFVSAELARLRVGNHHVGVVAGLQTPVVLCEIFPPDDFPLYFYGRNPAPDMMIEADEIDGQAVIDAAVFWLTVTGLSAEPSRSAHHRALALRGRTRHTVLDLDHRPMFWSGEAEARDQIAAALPGITVAVGNLEECRVATGEPEAAAAAKALLDRGVEIAVVKQGPAGVLGLTATEQVVVPPVPVDVVNGLGAGDSFGGALCHGLLAGWPLERTLRFANAAGAIVAGRLECSTAMPTSAEVEAVLVRGRV